ncbi:MAG TPA: hypothetical protein VFW96_09595 [Thermomicrobiales bacterium]|nr:hypothetical protein [Thermomicrobiales bacterium]
MSRDDDGRDDPESIIDAGLRGLARGLEGLRGFVTQIADPTAAPPKPIVTPHRPPREASRAVPANGSGAREPLVDVFDEGEVIRVVADMPGADPDTLRLGGEGNRLTIAASGPARRYERTVALPAPVRDGGPAPTFINGIMEALLPAVRPAPPPTPEPEPVIEATSDPAASTSDVSPPLPALGEGVPSAAERSEAGVRATTPPDDEPDPS